MNNNRTAQARIIKATYSLLNETPLPHLTIDSIIKTSNVARASFYYYYNDKFDVALNVFKNYILGALVDARNSNFKWKARILKIYECMATNKKFLHNFFDIKDIYPIYISLTRYYCSAFKEYIAFQGVDVNSIAIRKAIQNVAQTDMLVIYQYGLGKIDDDGLNKLSHSWVDTSPKILFEYIK